MNIAQPAVNDTSPSMAALIAGFGLLMMAILAPFANFFALENLVVSNDAKATVGNILAAEGLFRLGVSGFVVVVVLDVIVAWALHVLFEPLNRNLSLLAAWLRVAFAAAFAIALNPLLNVLQLLTSTESSGLEPSQVQAQVMLALGAFRSGWDIALVFFGAHLIVLGYLTVHSSFIPRWLSALLGIAGLGYVADSFGKFLFADYHLTIALFTFVGEFLLIFWLLWRGFRPTPRSNTP